MKHRVVFALTTLLWPLTVGAVTGDEYLARVDRLESRVTALEGAEGPFTDALFEPLVSLAELHIAEGDFDSATDTLHRAQNISHRNHGVHTPRQLELVSMLTNMALANGSYDDANRQQKFRFFVTRHHLDDSNPEVLSAYAEMGEWFMNTGQTRRARRLLNEGITLAEHLEQTPLPLAILINKTRRMEGLNTHPESLLATLEPIERNDRDTVVSARLEIADSLILSRKHEQAAAYYGRVAEMSALAGNSGPQPITMKRNLARLRADTDRFRLERNFFGQTRLDRMTREEMLEDHNVKPQWFLMNANQTRQGFNIPDSHQRGNLERKTEQLIGDPLLFSEEQLGNLLSHRIKKRLHELRIEVSFTVLANGDLDDIEIIESTAPIKLDRLIMDSLRRVYYRPALENGIPVEQHDFRLIQTFTTSNPGV